MVERGFVLSSFPMSTEQMVLLVDGNRVPDAVFAVDLPEDEAVRRLFSMRKALKRAGPFWRWRVLRLCCCEEVRGRVMSGGAFTG